MTVIAIDPGTKESAYVIWNGRIILEKAIVPNEQLLALARSWNYGNSVIVGIEMIACYGMAVGAETFETCVLIGRLVEALSRRGMSPVLIFRKQVCLHHCMSARATDSNIRQALIDKYGAPGTKKAPGKTYGVKSHIWAAFAIAAYMTETQIWTLNTINNNGKGQGETSLGNSPNTGA